ncbi:13998_t:CDS:2 [Entrophospora sp. SA101]|nr:131_t:CDS:2 [Entrophospora sp. SA101]CAJ0879697.1 13998_t:CDS:2 [Entrophospora sp. SA101]
MSDQQISKFYSPLPPTTDNQLKVVENVLHNVSKQQLLSDNCKTKSKSSITPQPNSTTLSTLKNGHLISKDESTTPITIPALVEAPRKKLDSSSSPFTTSTASTISENGTATQQLSTAVSVGSTSSEPSDTKLNLQRST